MHRFPGRCQNLLKQRFFSTGLECLADLDTHVEITVKNLTYHLMQDVWLLLPVCFFCGLCLFRNDFQIGDLTLSLQFLFHCLNVTFCERRRQFFNDRIRKRQHDRQFRRAKPLILFA